MDKKGRVGLCRSGLSEQLRHSASTWTEWGLYMIALKYISKHWRLESEGKIAGIVV